MADPPKGYALRCADLELGRKKAPRMYCDHCNMPFHDLFNDRCPVCLAVYHAPSWQRKIGKKSKRSTVRRELSERDGAACRRCNTTRRLTIDHIIPLSRGGTWSLDNLQILCGDCNSLKADLIPEPGQWWPTTLEDAA